MTVRSTSVDRDHIQLTVTDNGQGIPTYEQQVIDADKETALNHGSGLGLWLVRWGIEKLGGDVSMTVPDSGGTRVDIVLPTPVDG